VNRQNFRMALQGIAANRLRSALTMLGIMIGVGSVILLVAVGNGSSVAIQNNLDSLGTDTLTVFAGGGGFFAAGGRHPGAESQQITLTAQDVRNVSKEVNDPDVSAVSPIIQDDGVTASHAGSTWTASSFYGVYPSAAPIENDHVRAGRFISQADLEDHANVVVLGTTAVKSLFGRSSENPIGAQVNFSGTTFTVIGVLKSKGSNGIQKLDTVAVIPATTMQDHYTGTANGYSEIVASATSPTTVSAARSEIISTLASDHGLTTTEASNDFSVESASTLISASTSSSHTFTVLLGAVAAISLLVGGIGVMNIMLVTVTERTREIGIRKAIGARRSDILGQFLVEAVLLSVLGGILGIAAGLVGSLFKIITIQPVVAPYSVFLAFGFALLTGLFFGIYPANRAATLRPIDALRYE
jgi:putative ABC transport system permease protein